jgi:PAS domain S-box-containing protein
MTPVNAQRKDEPGAAVSAVAPAWAEADRLAALERYRILDTSPEPEFDGIVRIAAQICGVPMALISLVDDKRQWFKSALGLDATETPREVAFCDHAIQEEQVFIVNDAATDERFAENPLVTGDPKLRFYAGAQLVTPDGFPLGTLCVLDRQPRTLTEEQYAALRALAQHVMTQLELRHALQMQRVTEARQRLILESAVDYGIISMDLKGLVTSWNEGAHRIFGWTEAEMCGRRCDDFFTPEDCKAGVPEKEMGAALSHGRGSDERWHIRKDGERFWASGEMMPLLGDDGEPAGFLKIVRDRTEQRRIEQALRESEMRTRFALEAADLGTWDARPETGELHWDARTRELFGHDLDDELDYEASFLTRVHEGDRALVDERVREALSPEGGVLDVQYRVGGLTDAKPRWVHAKGRRVEDDLGRQRFVGTIRDITAEKAAESHRELLTRELQHRIKNTLAVVQGIVSQSLRTVATPAEAREAISNRLMTLSHAHDLLTQTSWTAAPIVAVIGGAIQVLGDLSARVDVAGPDVALKARSALALSMALHELTTNAAKYGALSNTEGRVDLHWSMEGEGEAARLLLTWREHGGPPVSPPTRTGFGSRLMNSLSQDLGGKTELLYDTDGVRWTLAAVLSEVREV